MALSPRIWDNVGQSLHRPELNRHDMLRLESTAVALTRLQSKLHPKTKVTTGIYAGVDNFPLATRRLVREWS
jgi:hypothetical protein